MKSFIIQEKEGCDVSMVDEIYHFLLQFYSNKNLQLRAINAPVGSNVDRYSFLHPNILFGK